MSTLTEPSTVDMSEFEYQTDCEWEGGCSKPAEVMSLACGDDRPHGICLEHLLALQRWFDSHRNKRCVCGRPFIYFDTHYSIISL